MGNLLGWVCCFGVAISWIAFQFSRIKSDILIGHSGKNINSEILIF